MRGAGLDVWSRVCDIHGIMELERAEKVLAKSGDGVFGAEDIAEAAACVRAALRAEKPVWNQRSGSSERSVPDYATQLNAAKLVLSYGVGLPVQRVLQINKDFSPDDELRATLATPAGREALELLARECPELTGLKPAKQPRPADVAELPLFAAPGGAK